jgi:hypothetical protein
MTDESVFSKSTASQPLESSRSCSQSYPVAIESEPFSSESDQFNNRPEDKILQDVRLSKVSEQSSTDDDLNSSLESEAKVDSFVGRGFSSSSTSQSKFHIVAISSQDLDLVQDSRKLNLGLFRNSQAFTALGNPN